MSLPGQSRTVLQTTWNSNVIGRLVVNPFAPLRFRRTTCLVDPTTGDIRLNEDSVDRTGELSKEPLKLNKRDMGLTKDVYMVSAQSTSR